MSILPTRRGESSRSGDPSQYGISNTRAGRTMTNSAHGDRIANVGNLSNCDNTTINVGASDESSRIQEWLSPLQPRRRHQDVSNRRLGGVGDWVLERNEFESWQKNQDGSGNPTLLCYGGQGVGKTYISSLVIDRLHELTCGQNIPVLFLYCDYQAQQDQSAVNMIGSLLRQISFGSGEIPAGIYEAFESKESGSQGLRLPDMVKLFVKIIGSMERTYICFDAVDELQPQNRSELLRALRKIIRDAPNARLFLTGRPHIRGELDKHLTKEAHTVHIVANQEDIAGYISQKMDVDCDRDPELMPDDLKNGIKKTVIGKASEMFLLVALNIAAILNETTIAQRKKLLHKVETIGADLDSVYALTLQRIRDQQGGRSRLGIAALMWVSHAERPLRIEELCHALAVDVESKYLDLENLCPADAVLGSCLGLLTVDKETSTVRLIHYTLKEYLSLPGILPYTHGTLAQICLAYLSYEKVKALPADKFPDLRNMPFLEYSSLYWGRHAKVELTYCATSLTLGLFQRYDNHVAATILLNHPRRSISPLAVPSSFAGLHCACYFGIVYVVGLLIESRGCDINQRDCRGFTPVMWASRQGNAGVVRLLLERDDLFPDTPDNDGRTALSWACYNGHEGVVGLLLARDYITPDIPDNYGRTALWWACYNGHEGAVRLLLVRDDVIPDKPDNDGRTPLWWACYGGHEGVVRLLLVRDDVILDRPDYGNQTPLCRACYNGHEEVVRLLLARRDAIPNKADNNGQTPLWRACCNRYEGVVRPLLARDDIIPDTPDNDGRTPLWFACSNGHEEVVRLLLARDDVILDRADDYGRTPLGGACCVGHEGIVGLLLASGDVIPDRQDGYGITPFCWACCTGREGIVRLLLARDDVTPDMPDQDGRTPLSWACFGGHEAIVRLLLARDDVIPDKPDRIGQTPLWRACFGGDDGVVRLLLARDDVIPDTPDNDGQTPLWCACDNGNMGAVRLLLARDDVILDKPDNNGQTPLWCACRGGH